MDIFVSVAKCGYGDDVDTNVVYAGCDHETARLALVFYSFPSERNNSMWIEHWKDGNHIKNEKIEI